MTQGASRDGVGTLKCEPASKVERSGSRPKPTAETLRRASRQLALGRTHICVEKPAPEFTELSLTEAELDQLCVIPSRRPAAQPPVARWRPALRPAVRSARRASRSLQAVVAAGMAWLTLPSCRCDAGPATPATPVVQVMIGQIRVARLPRAALPAEPAATAMMREAIRGAAGVNEAAHHARAVHAPPRPTAVVADGRGLLEQASKAMELGQFKTALGIYQRLLHRQPSQVDGLFGAAFASHELREVKIADAYLKRALAVQPNHPLANILSGFRNQVSHRYGAARDHYARFLAVESQGDRADEIRAVVGALPQPAGAIRAGGR